MRGRKILAMIMLCLLTIDIPIFSVTMVSADPVYKQIQGVVNPNSTTGVRAYDPVQNGFVYYYIQNRTNEGNGTDPMETNPSPPPVFDYYDPEIHLGISDWQVGDECILVIDREYGNYSTNDHAGYIAFTNVTLDGLVGVQMAPTTELQKITTPTFVGNGTGYIEITWDPLNDTNGLIEGYKIYRSTTNGTVWGDDDWTLVGGSVNAPLNVTNFNDTSVIGGTTYYYSVKVVFTGYQNNDPGQVDNYQNQYFGEGSVPMNTFTNGGIPGAPTDLRVHKGGEEWAGSSGDIVLNWTAPVIDFGFLVKNIVYYDMDITDGFQYTSFIEFDPNASAGGDPDWCILPGWDADSNNYSFIVRTTGDIQGGLENLTGTNIGYKYIMILQKNPGPGTQFKWISIPYYSDYMIASDICSPVEEFTNNTVIDTLVKWNFTSQENYYRHWALFPPPAHWQGDFVINPGDSLGIIVTTDVAYEWSIVGSHNDSLQFELIKNPAPITQFKTLSLPYHMGYNQASDISGPGAEFVDGSIIEVVMKWNYSTQQFDYRSWYGPPFNTWIGDFNIEPGDAIGFIIALATSYYWTPEVITL